ncbi:hypothetical protein DRE_04262 [Drechslerella stenobrocha 248]|uniref:CorA-like transporter domain-containing protein n=1 Tax=Drechslerella stenobrocha 248 TaxID=1043628 RepID=W7HT80_9PEZI|nr:hypothetical protein DRE_04262 [Drechslerella stenobrocha 248]
MVGFGDAWETYPSRLAENVPLGCDTDQVRADIEGDQARLFSDRDDFPLWFANDLSQDSSAPNERPNEVEKHQIQNLATLKELWLDNNRTHGTAFYMISPKRSWAQLKATANTFRRILAFHEVFPPFFKVVHSYGSRTEDDNETYDAFSQITSVESQDYEICYNLRYFELNGRVPENPWSLRQTGVYHKYNAAIGKSVWIFLRPSERMIKLLENTLRYDSANSSIDTRAVLIYHALFISAALHSWKSYISFLESKLKKAEEISRFSNADQSNRNDYALDFSTCQELETLRYKLLKVLALLESTENIINGVALHHEKLQCTTETEQNHNERLTTAIDGYISEITYHRNRVSALLQRCTSTAKLLSSILAHRNAKLVLEATEASRRTLEAMEKLANGQEQENKISQGHAITGKALTLMATLYLPISLIASIFSSNLIETQTDSDDDSSVAGSYFVIAPDFWKFIVVVIPLTLATFALVRSMEYIMNRSAERKRIKGDQRVENKESDTQNLV